MKINFNKKLIAMGLIASFPLGVFADNTVKINGTSFTGTAACAYSDFSVDSNGVLTLNLSSSACLAADDGGDHVAPVITLNGANPVNLTVGGIYTEVGATATDDVDGTINVGAPSGSVNTAVASTYTLTYSASDAAGNTSSKTRQVIVTSSTTGGNGGSNNIADLTASILDPQGAVKVTQNPAYSDVSSFFVRAIKNESGQDRNLYIVNMGKGGSTALPSVVNNINVQLNRTWNGAIKSDLYAVRFKTPSNFSSGRFSVQNMEFGGSRTRPATGKYTISATPGSMTPINATGKCSTTALSDTISIMSEANSLKIPAFLRPILLPSKCILEANTIYYFNAELSVANNICNSRGERCNLYFEGTLD